MYVRTHACMYVCMYIFRCMYVNEDENHVAHLVFASLGSLLDADERVLPLVADVAGDVEDDVFLAFLPDDDHELFE